MNLLKTNFMLDFMTKQGKHCDATFLIRSGENGITKWGSDYKAGQLPLQSWHGL